MIGVIYSVTSHHLKRFFFVCSVWFVEMWIGNKSKISCEMTTDAIILIRFAIMCSTGIRGKKNPTIFLNLWPTNQNVFKISLFCWHSISVFANCFLSCFFSSFYTMFVLQLPMIHPVIRCFEVLFQHNVCAFIREIINK